MNSYCILYRLWLAWGVDILFRPDRMSYVKQDMGAKDSCVFCKQRDEGLNFETLVLYKGELSMTLLNKYPYNGGHMLVLPTRHESSLLNLSPEEYSSLNALLRSSLAILRDVLNPSAVNIGVNMGADAGAGLPGHLHYHIVPRWKGDTNFFPITANSKVLPSDLETVYNKLSPSFKDLEQC